MARPKNSLTGPDNPRWKGGRRIDDYGYVAIRLPGHPHARSGYVREHRLVMERELGRVLEPHELVHHRNGDKTDNRIENLELTTRAEHRRMHVKLTYELACEIRALHATGEWSYSKLAQRFGVSKPTIGDIVRGWSWPAPGTLGRDWKGTRAAHEDDGVG